MDGMSDIPDTECEILKAPFPYFGGKSRVAKQIWEAFGEVRNYTEPFAGSLACLLGRPRPFEGVETVNDKDGFISNFWRALQAEPDEVARWAGRPVFENDLHAVHAWLVGAAGDLASLLEGDPRFFDPEIAGNWVWGLCCWIGHGWCSGKGPWRVIETDKGKQLLKANTYVRGVFHAHLGDAGQGVKRTLPHLGPARGVSRQGALASYLRALAARLQNVRVCCGDWRRVCGGKSGESLGALFAGNKTISAIFLDPPYSVTDRENCYNEDSRTVATDVATWCKQHGDDPRFRIVLAGYAGEHELPGWKMLSWKGHGGYGNQSTTGQGRDNAKRETLWLSPHCLPVCLDQKGL